MSADAASETGGETFSQVIGDGRQFLEGLKGAQRLAILTVEKSGPMARAMEGFDAAALAEEGGFQHLVNQATLKGTNQMVLDATQDNNFKGITLGKLRSALCLAARDAAGQVVGVLYADSSEPGAFSYQDLSSAEKFAGSYGQRIKSAIRPVAATGTSVREVGPRAAAVCLALAALWAMGGLLTQVPTPPPVQPRPEDLARKAAPEAVASWLLNDAQTRDFASSYRLMSKRHRTHLSEDAYRRGLQSWIANPDNRSDLERRRTAPKSAATQRSQVLVSSTNRPPNPTWTWSLVKEEDGWKIDAWNAGPFPSTADSGASTLPPLTKR